MSLGPQKPGSKSNDNWRKYNQTYCVTELAGESKNADRRVVVDLKKALVKTVS